MHMYHTRVRRIKRERSVNILSSKKYYLLRHREQIAVVLFIGESNVYTLGNIGGHRIVCTKLPTVGHTREAMTAAGNTTTRLLGTRNVSLFLSFFFNPCFYSSFLILYACSYAIFRSRTGTFQKVDYVFLVGVGGGVPHYTDYNKHVRLGDVVISHPTPLNKKYTYVYCESAKMSESGDYHFETKEYCPPNLGLQEIAATLKKQVKVESITLREHRACYTCLKYMYVCLLPFVDRERNYSAVANVLEGRYGKSGQSIGTRL